MEDDKNFNQIMDFLMGDGRRPSVSVIIKDIERNLKQKIKKGDMSAASYLNETYNKYRRLSESYIHPDFLFNSPDMYNIAVRFKNSAVVYDSHEDQSMNTEDLPSFVPFPVLNKYSGEIPVSELVESEHNSYFSPEEEKILTGFGHHFSGKIIQCVHDVSELEQLDKCSTDLSLNDISAFDLPVNQENMRLYRQIYSIPLEARERKVLHLRELLLQIEQLERKYSISLKSGDPVLEFIKLDSCWNKHTLSILYDSLVKKEYVEPNRKTDFVSFFTGLNEIRNVRRIVWYKYDSQADNIPEMYLLLVGLKSMRRLGAYLESFKIKDYIGEFVESKLVVRKQRIKELSSTSCDKTYKNQREKEKLVAECGDLRERRLNLSRRVYKLPLYSEDVRRLLNLFVDKEYKEFNKKNLHFNKCDISAAFEFYEILESALSSCSDKKK